MKGVAPEAEERNEARARAMWERYVAGSSLHQVARHFGIRPQTVHTIFRVRGWQRRRLAEAQLLRGDCRAHRQLLAALERLHVACEAIGCSPADCEATLGAMIPEAAARIRALARRDLVALLSTPSEPFTRPIPTT